MLETDLLIIGAGPAGLSAALEADKHGIKTVLIDESYSLGGQLIQQTQFLKNLPKEFDKQRGTTLAARLDEKITASNVKVLLKHTMIGAYENGNIGVSDGKVTFPINAKRIIIATGAAEKANVFPGWTRPGVLTVGAAQLLMNKEYVLPGNNAMILGSTDFSMEVASQLSACGVNVKGIIESGNKVLCKNRDVIHSLEHIEIPVFLNSSIVGSTGKESLEKITVSHDGLEEDYIVDLVCIGNGVTPIIEPFEIMDCQLTYKKELGGWVPNYYESLETSTKSVYVAGNAAGITYIGSIMLTGKIAALSALTSLDIIKKEWAKEQEKILWKEIYKIEANEAESIFNVRRSFIQDFHKEFDVAMSDSILKRC